MKAEDKAFYWRRKYIVDMHRCSDCSKKGVEMIDQQQCDGLLKGSVSVQQK